METGENNATFGILANGDRGTFVRRGRIGDEQISQLFVVNLVQSVYYNRLPQDSRSKNERDSHLDIGRLELPILVEAGTLSEARARTGGISRRGTQPGGTIPIMLCRTVELVEKELCRSGNHT